MAKSKKEEPKTSSVTEKKHGGVPMTDEQKKDFEKTWKDIEDSMTKAYKKK